jgi:hypothetical protein
MSALGQETSPRKGGICLRRMLGGSRGGVDAIIVRQDLDQSPYPTSLRFGVYQRHDRFCSTFHNFTKLKI